MEFARQIVRASPDAVQSTKRALLLSKRCNSVQEAVSHHLQTPECYRVYSGHNYKVRDPGHTII